MSQRTADRAEGTGNNRKRMHLGETHEADDSRIGAKDFLHGYPFLFPVPSNLSPDLLLQLSYFGTISVGICDFADVKIETRAWQERCQGE